VKYCQDVLTIFIRIQFDIIIIYCTGGKEAKDSIGLNKLIFCYPFQKIAGVIIKLASLLPNSL